MLLTIDYPALIMKIVDKALPQSELLAQAGISQAVIRQIKSGKPIRPETVGKIVRVLDCDPAEIATPVMPIRKE